MWWLLAVLGVVLLGAALWGPIVSNTEEPKYQIAESSGNIEIRDYPPMIVAEAEVSGDRRDAIGKGFRTIADYIFGNNTTEARQTVHDRGVDVAHGARLLFGIGTTSKTRWNDLMGRLARTSSFIKVWPTGISRT